MKFGWNRDKAMLNLSKHSVFFQEAATVFNDLLSLTFPDPDHSIGERWVVGIAIIIDLRQQISCSAMPTLHEDTRN